MLEWHFTPGGRAEEMKEERNEIGMIEGVCRQLVKAAKQGTSSMKIQKWTNTHANHPTYLKWIHNWHQTNGSNLIVTLRQSIYKDVTKCQVMNN